MAESEQIRLDGGIHAANGPASGKDTAPDKVRIVLVKALHTGQLDESLPARRRGTRRQPVAGDSMAASMPPKVSQALRTPHQSVLPLLS
nr:hypothetical protein [Xanthomonas euvesicatoria]